MDQDPAGRQAGATADPDAGTNDDDASPGEVRADCGHMAPAGTLWESKVQTYCRPCALQRVASWEASPGGRTRISRLGE